MDIRAVLFDLIGTSVREKDPATIENCVVRAFADHNIRVPPVLIRNQRGKAKREMISSLLVSLKAPLHLTPSVLKKFKEHFKGSLKNFETNEGFFELVTFLKNRGMLSGLGTGLTPDLADMLLQHLKWNREEFAYIGTANEAGRGRPHPDMINHMLSTLSLQPRQLLKVGDTAADIQEGKNAGTLTAVLLAGTQDEVSLVKLHPDFILHSLSELMEILGH
jgi:HAD superfamily hydrolase (TIGR01549 family)